VNDRVVRTAAATKAVNRACFETAACLLPNEQQVPGPWSTGPITGLRPEFAAMVRQCDAVTG
jgi:hypothetical protein